MMAKTDNRAFIELLNENLGIAHKVARAYFAQVEDREDLLQEMMYQLWRSFPRFDGRSKFSTWMYSVCLNTALTYRRKNTRPGSESLLLHHLQIRDDSTQEPDLTSDLFNAINSLNELNKAIILLYLEDLSYEEMASITGLTKSNISVRLVRIKKELESILKSKPGEYVNL